MTCVCMRGTGRDSTGQRVRATVHAKLPGIRAPRHPMAIAALQHMALALLGLRGSARVLALFRDVLNTILQSGLFCESDGYFDYLRQGPEPGHQARVTEGIASKGLGEVGAVHIAHSIWRQLVPRNLRKHYARCTRAAQQPRFAPHSQNTVGRMLESVRVDTRGMRHTKARVSSSVFLRYKNAEKCRLLLNAVRINASDHRAPKAVSAARATADTGGSGGGLVRFYTTPQKEHTGTTHTHICSSARRHLYSDRSTGGPVRYSKGSMGGPIDPTAPAGFEPPPSRQALSALPLGQRPPRVYYAPPRD